MKTVVVDDEARIRRGVERLVLSCGNDWQVVGSFSSGTECLDEIKKNNLAFDILITDIKMPKMDGLTLIIKLKEITSFYSVVISGFDDLEYLQTAIREGASDYLIKPIDREDFSEQLNRIKEKKVAKMNQLQKIKEFQVKASQLNYVNQIQKLSDVTRQQDIDLSLLEWTKDFPRSNYQLMYVSIDNIVSKSKKFDSDDWRTWAFAIENIIDEMIVKHRAKTSLQVWKWRDKELSYWILLQQEKSNHEMGIKFANQMKENIKSYTPLSCSIAVGRTFEDLTLLSNKRDEVLTYMRYRVLYGANQLIDYNREELDTEDKNDYKYIKNAIERIIFSLGNHDSEKTLEEIGKFLNRLQKEAIPEEIEQSIKLLGIRMINVLVKDGGGTDDFVLIEKIFDIPTKTSNFTELRNEVYDWSKQILTSLETSNDSSTYVAEPIEIAKKWIMQNLHEKITIPKIASQVYMNPTYFCEYFKRYTGETILDFVTRTRIERAKELLLNRELKIYDISVQVGYSDPKYFSSLFKEYYGDTPSQYRQHTILEKI